MSAENVELSYRAAEAFNRRDLDAFLALQANDVEGVPLASDMEGGYRGRGAGGAVPVDMTIWRVSRWRAGQCIWWGSFRSESEAEAIEAMDLSDQV